MIGNGSNNHGFLTNWEEATPHSGDGGHCRGMEVDDGLDLGSSFVESRMEDVAGLKGENLYCKRKDTLGFFDHRQIDQFFSHDENK